MTVEVKAAAVQVAEEPVKKVAEEEIEKVEGEMKCENDESKPKMVEKSSSYKEESNFLSDLKEHEKKALNELKSKLEEAIVGNSIFEKKAAPETPPQKEAEKPAEKCEEPAIEGEEKLTEKCEPTIEEKPDEKCEEPAIESEEKPIENCEPAIEEKPVEECEEPAIESDEQTLIDEDISIWGIPLLPSKGNESTNIVLLKFLRAREFKIYRAGRSSSTPPTTSSPLPKSSAKFAIPPPASPPLPSIHC